MATVTAIRRIAIHYERCSLLIISPPEKNFFQRLAGIDRHHP
jgi:hypothetical protein